MLPTGRRIGFFRGVAPESQTCGQPSITLLTKGRLGRVAANESAPYNGGARTTACPRRWRGATRLTGLEGDALARGAVIRARFRGVSCRQASPQASRSK
jgi:hypothetical protein